MSKTLVELAYERMNHELSTHWSRINLTWLIVTAAYTATGYLMYEVAKSRIDESDVFLVYHERLHLLLVLSSASAFVASVVWRTIIVSGNYWVQVWEQKIGVLELSLDKPLYLELAGKENDVRSLLNDYLGRYGVYPKKHPSITVAYSHLSLIAIMAGSALLVVSVMWPDEFGLLSESNWRHYSLLALSVFAGIVIEWPIAIDLRQNNRVIAEQTVNRLIEAAQREAAQSK